MRTAIARKTIQLPDYNAKRLDQCHMEIVRYYCKEKAATTIAERKFCQQMVEMYKKRYNWYLK